MQKRVYYIINGITIYRLVAAFMLAAFIFLRRADIFQWLLALSFFTDAIDGFLARRYRVTSAMGSRIDSIADDLTVLAAILGTIVLKPGFLQEHVPFIVLLAVLYVTQTVMALVRYGKMSSFHTYAAKGAALLQGIFFLVLFFLPGWATWFFYLAASATAIDLLEEIVLVAVLPTWETDVKGFWWVRRRKAGK